MWNPWKRCGVCAGYKNYKFSHRVVKNFPRSGHSSTAYTEENGKKMKEALFKNHCINLKGFAMLLNFPYGTVQQIAVNILGMRRVAARLVLKDLNFTQRDHRNTTAEYFNWEAKNDPTFKKQIITYYETCVWE